MSYASVHHKNDEHTDLLKGVDMVVEDGKVTALIGGNGAGKTTLFNIISGFEKSFKGKVFFNGKNITKWPPHRIARKGIGRLFQGLQLSEDLTLLENMKIASNDTTGEHPWDVFFPIRVAKREAAKKEKAIEILTKVFGPNNEYLDKLNEKASGLSYGQQRLIALVRLLMTDNKLFLLDEPTSGVNPALFEQFRTIIRDMVEKEGKTVLLIEHNMGFVYSVADSCFRLSKGTLTKTELEKKKEEGLER